ncbi:MAG: gliding motility protein GldC [Sphingobacteriales bacterium]|nr:MAG: gliding motility protein GldC [Sphingobacteriales bacterium]
MSQKSNINIQIELDEEKMPEIIEWNAPDGGVDGMQKAKGMLLGLWDGEEKSALRIDLWTKKMMVDEMNDFFYQTFLGMADTYLRATRNQELATELKEFGKSFHKKASAALEKENNQGN